MSERRQGFYWCRPPEDSGVLGWGIAYWTGLSWYFRTPWGDLLNVGDVGPRIPTPGEGWVCVPKSMTESMRSALTVGSATDAPIKEPTKFWDDAYARMLSKSPSPDDTP